MWNREKRVTANSFGVTNLHLTQRPTANLYTTKRHLLIYQQTIRKLNHVVNISPSHHHRHTPTLSTCRWLDAISPLARLDHANIQYLVLFWNIKAKPCWIENNKDSIENCSPLLDGATEPNAE
jgi:hypothetical protein